ncbi:hypothetical protein [Paenibacillus piri]|uniref:Uncharacterized protein n=1 Tax=Paenibacillus piri TaxID=2547395 RepID=A0A4V2ZUG6_9BACL|nr:hypothetical protein [Paenibacillus piri]TDG00885.1 hypothetical protein E1757_04545 [Paenibacillus piri]
MSRTAKPLIGLFLLILLTCVLFSGRTYASSMYDDNVPSLLPSNAYYFETNGVMRRTTSDSQLFDQILKDRQSSVIADMKKIGADQFIDKTISGGIDTSGGIDFWNYDLSQLQQRKESVVVTIHRGSTPYSIFIPRGKKEVPIPNDPEGRTMWVEVNQKVISASKEALSRYLLMVKEGVIFGSLASSYNIYSMYPEQQVPLTDILQDAKEAKGVALGYQTIKSSGVTMRYSLDGFYNPLFGKMDISMILKSGFSWTSKVNEVKIGAGGSDDKITIGISDEFLDFMRPDSPIREGLLSDIDRNIVASANGVKSVRAALSGIAVEPKNMVDVGMRLIVPSTFSKNDLKNYPIVTGKKGYKLINGIKMRITENMIYKFDEVSGKNEKLGNYDDFGIYLNSLVLGSTITPDGRTVGAVIPLWYKEVVVSTAASDAGTLYYTGRTVKMGNDYSSKLSLDGMNKDLFGIDTKSSGLQAIDVRKFAFTEEADHLKREDHNSVGQAPENFRLKLIFNTTDEEAKGFSIIRNNYYIDDPNLITWLESSEAKAMTGVKADVLYKLITGGIEIDNKPLTYEQWNRMQEIRSELDSAGKSKLMTFIKVIVLIAGVFLIFYSLMLIIAYWIDILNPLFDFSILNMMTFKRLYPVAGEDDMGYITSKAEGTSYVTFPRILIHGLLGMVCGLLFIFGEPVLEFILWIYYKVVSFVGVV